MGARVLTYGDWEIRVLDEDLLRLTLKGAEPPIDILWYVDHEVKVKELVNYLGVLEETLAKGGFSTNVKKTFYELARVNGEWVLRARGALNFELAGLDTRQATCIALLLTYAREEDPLESDFLRAVRLMGLLPVLESVREVRLKGLSVEAVLSWRENELVIRPVRASFPSELRTLLSLVDAGIIKELELRVEAAETAEEMAASMLLGEFDEENLNEELLVPVRRELVKLVLGHVPYEGEVEILEDKVVVRNAYGTWEISLKDGDTYLNDRDICIEPETPASTILVLPGVRELELGKTSIEVVAALMVALRPEDVKDRRLREQIERAASGSEEDSEF